MRGASWVEYAVKDGAPICPPSRPHVDGRHTVGVDTDEARAVLGVEAGTPWAEVKRAFRRRLRAVHPDVAGNDATGRTARLIEAYEALRAAPGLAPFSVVGNDTIAFDGPAEDVFFRLLEAAHHIGEVTYVDADAGLLETVVQLEGGPTASLVVTLQGRGNGATEAFCTLEPIGSSAALPASAAVEVLATHL